jgi:hypothetical protein
LSYLAARASDAHAPYSTLSILIPSRRRLNCGYSRRQSLLNTNRVMAKDWHKSTSERCSIATFTALKSRARSDLGRTGASLLQPNKCSALLPTPPGLVQHERSYSRVFGIANAPKPPAKGSLGWTANQASTNHTHHGDFTMAKCDPISHDYGREPLRSTQRVPQSRQLPGRIED